MDGMLESPGNEKGGSRASRTYMYQILWRGRGEEVNLYVISTEIPHRSFGVGMQWRDLKLHELLICRDDDRQRGSNF